MNVLFVSTSGLEFQLFLDNSPREREREEKKKKRPASYSTELRCNKYAGVLNRSIFRTVCNNTLSCSNVA